MALTQIVTSVTQLEEQRVGYIQMYLDDMTDGAEPLITEGSVIEIAGSIANVQGGDEDIDVNGDWAGFANDTQVYGYINGSTFVPHLTTTAPTWNDEKQGWYDATGTHRYYLKIYKDAGGNYDNKALYTNIKNIVITENGIEIETSIIKSSGLTDAITIDAKYIDASAVESKVGIKTKIIEIGDWNMDSDLGVTVDHGLGADFYKIRNIDVYILDDTGNNMYNLLGLNGFTASGILGLISSAGIVIQRIVGGYFDNVTFDSTSYNRGWVFITHEE